MTYSKSNDFITEDVLYELEKTIHNKSVILNQYMAFGLDKMAEKLKKDVHDSSNRLAQMKLAYYAQQRARASANRLAHQNGALPNMYHYPTGDEKNASGPVSANAHQKTLLHENTSQSRLATYIPGQRFRVLPASCDRGAIRLKPTFALQNPTSNALQQDRTPNRQ